MYTRVRTHLHTRTYIIYAYTLYIIYKRTNKHERVCVYIIIYVCNTVVQLQCHYHLATVHHDLYNELYYSIELA